MAGRSAPGDAPATGDSAETSPDAGRLAQASLPRRPRQGWADAAQSLAEAGDDAPVWPEFGNTKDGALTW